MSKGKRSINVNQTMRVLLVSWMVLFLVSVAAWAERMAVSVPEANMRSGPGMQYDSLWKAEQFTPVEVMDKDPTGEWLFFKDFEGTKAWVSKSLVGKIDSVITKNDLCNIRKEPSTNADVIFKAERGVPFKVVKRQKDWIQIQHADGDIGWIHKDLVW
jgi:SH3-like domain-containing protein